MRNNSLIFKPQVIILLHSQRSFDLVPILCVCVCGGGGGMGGVLSKKKKKNTDQGLCTGKSWWRRINHENLFKISL